MNSHLTETLQPEELLLINKMAIQLLQEGAKQYDGEPHSYFDLAIWLGFLRAIGMIHHTHHWQIHGNPFYGDHLLLERLYKEIEDQVDTLGEKVVGLGSPVLVNIQSQLKHMFNFVDKTLNQQDILLESLKIELIFIACGEMVAKRLEEANLLTKGLENLMGGILDHHEGFVYLLNQRLNLY